MGKLKVVIVLLIVGAVAVVLLALPQGQSSSDSALSGDTGTLIAAPATEAQQKIRVTARGRNIKAFSKGAAHTASPVWSHDADTQDEMDAASVITTFPDGRVGLRLGEVGRNRSVAMSPNAPDDEGALLRIHVDRPEQGNGNGHSGQLMVIGIYDALTSEKAITGQAFKCKKCGNVTVCGVSPQCVD